MHRVFVVDDHPVIVRTYARRIDEAGDLMVCGTATSFGGALEALPEARADVAVVDVSLGNEASGGLALIRRLSDEMAADAPCWLVVSARNDPGTARRAREVGDQFLPKHDASEALLETIRTLA